MSDATASTILWLMRRKVWACGELMGKDAVYQIHDKLVAKWVIIGCLHVSKETG